MNEEAIGVLYELAQGDGYSKTLDEFKALMQSNEDAVSDMYSLAQRDGYTKTISSVSRFWCSGLKKKSKRHLTFRFSNGNYGLYYSNGKKRWCFGFFIRRDNLS
jgi:hypothetical protein